MLQDCLYIELLTRFCSHRFAYILQYVPKHNAGDRETDGPSQSIVQTRYLVPRGCALVSLCNGRAIGFY